MDKKIGQQVQEFYNDVPFLDYGLERFKKKEDLNYYVYPFAKTIDRSIPKDVKIIDVGTGTGMTSAFLSLKRKNVVGIDFSDSSLNKARELKEKLNLDNWNLEKVDILDETQINKIIDKYGKFDYVLCLGVLHHTCNAQQGFNNLCKLLKLNGKIVVGLYHRIGRIPLKIRIFLAKTIFKNNQKVKDSFIKMQIGEVKDKERTRGWWHDQYLHVHETTHLVGEVLRWFKKNRIQFIQSIPSCEIFNKIELELSGLWNKERYPNIIERTWKQFTWLWKTQREGGYWITFGEKDGN